MIVFICAASNGRFRRAVSDDTQNSVVAAQTLANHHTKPGELALLAPLKSGGYSLDDIQSYITRQTGLTPSNDRFAVVSGGQVVGAGVMDRACGDYIRWQQIYADAQFIPSDEADAGWTYNGALIAPPEPPEVIANQQRKAV